MMCTNCKYEFCWICLQKYTDNHFSWWNCCGCPGMDYMERNSCNNKCGRCLCKILTIFSSILLYLLLFALIVAGFAIALAVAYATTVVLSPSLGYFFYRFFTNKEFPSCCKENIFLHILIIFFGIISSPISIPTYPWFALYIFLSMDPEYDD